MPADGIKEDIVVELPVVRPDVAPLEGSDIIRPPDDIREVLYLPLNFFAIQTLIFQSADRRHIKNISVI